MRDMAPYLSELSREGIDYAPTCFTAYGRWQPDALALFEGIARRAARRPGLDDHRLALRRLHTRVGVELICRAVTIVRRCAARATAEALRKEDAADDEMTAALR